MQSEYLTFDKKIIPGRKTPVYEVRNKQTSIDLGMIYFYPAWRKYVFAPAGNIIFDIVCLTDIIRFIDEIQVEWRAGLGKK